MAEAIPHMGYNILFYIHLLGMVMAFVVIFLVECYMKMKKYVEENPSAKIEWAIERFWEKCNYAFLIFGSIFWEIVLICFIGWLITYIIQTAVEIYIIIPIVKVFKDKPTPPKS